jgi:hypothetical protein
MLLSYGWIHDLFTALHQRGRVHFLFHSIVEAFGMRSAAYKPEYDIFAKPMSQ